MRMLLTIMLTWLLTSLNFAAADAGKIAGTWNTGEDNTLVEIVTQTEPAQGTLIQSDNDKAELGLLILTELQFDGEIWQGTVYSVKRDKYMPVKLQRSGDLLELEVKLGILRKTLNWTLVP